MNFSLNERGSEQEEDGALHVCRGGGLDIWEQQMGQGMSLDSLPVMEFSDLHSLLQPHLCAYFILMCQLSEEGLRLPEGQLSARHHRDSLYNWKRTWCLLQCLERSS